MAAGESPIRKLERLADQALSAARKAKRHRKSLSGDNFYANKLIELRAEATNTFSELSAGSSGDVSALAELIDQVFSAETKLDARRQAAKELKFSLLTTWKNVKNLEPSDDEGILPLQILVKANRGYLLSIGRQVNGTYQAGHYDACAVMMRRLVEVSIIDAYEAKGIEDRIKNADGNYLHLTQLVACTLQERTFKLSRNAKKYLPELKDIGHLSAHGKFYHARKPDLEGKRLACRVVIEEFLHHAGLV